jgi:hypothetical protein
MGRHTRRRAITSELDRPTSMALAADTPLGEALDILASGVSNPALPEGLPIRFDRALASRSGELKATPVSIDLVDAPLGTVLGHVLNAAGLTYVIKDGFVTINPRGMGR